MTESMIVEAIRSLRSVDPNMMQAAPAAASVPDPAAVSRFQAAMSANPVSDVQQVQSIPFADAASRSWQSAHDNNQGILHRIRALSEMSAGRALSAPELFELQYEVANLAFQQEVVTKVADKASTAVQTLIKNQ